MSDIRMVNVRSDCDASNPASLTITRSTCRSAWRSGSASSLARGVGYIPVVVRTRSSSSNIARNRLSALLIAGWLRPTRSAAFVTCRSVRSASSATSRLRSIERRFIYHSYRECREMTNPFHR